MNSKKHSTIEVVMITLATVLGHVTTAEAQPTLPQGLSYSFPTAYGVTVDYGRSTGIARDIYGVNRGPLDITSDTESVDYTSLYQRAHVGSVRLHEEGINASEVYTDDRVFDAVYAGSPVRQWEPNSTRNVYNPESYDFARADRQYQSVLAGGFEPYLRVGESRAMRETDEQGEVERHEGPTYSDHPREWGMVAANVARHFFGGFAPTQPFSRAPAFVEIWNEPDGRFWSGTVSQFQGLHQTAYARLSDVSAAEALGGPGFTQYVESLNPENRCETAAMDSVLKEAAFINCYMKNVLSDRRNFVSFHYYAGEVAADHGEHEAHEATPSETVESILASVHNLTVAGASVLHLNEWNIGDITNRTGQMEHFASARVGAFSSAMWSWLQAGEFSQITRAHFYPGSQHAAGMFFYSLGDGGHTTLCPGTQDPCFHVRPSGLAMSLHGDLAGLPLAPVSLASAPSLGGGWSWPTESRSVIDAARSDWPVTAVATDDGSVATVVLTNLSSAERSVRVRLRALGRRHCARVRTLANYEAANAYVSTSRISARERTLANHEAANAYVSRASVTIVPDPAQVEAVFNRFITTRYEGLSLTDDSSDREYNLPANSVVRVDVQSGAWPLSLCR